MLSNAFARWDGFTVASSVEQSSRCLLEAFVAIAAVS